MFAKPSDFNGRSANRVDAGTWSLGPSLVKLRIRMTSPLGECGCKYGAERMHRRINFDPPIVGLTSLSLRIDEMREPA
jgi:hypothetical protein